MTVGCLTALFSTLPDAGWAHQREAINAAGLITCEAPITAKLLTPQAYHRPQGNPPTIWIPQPPKFWCDDVMIWWCVFLPVFDLCSLFFALNILRNHKLLPRKYNLHQIPQFKYRIFNMFDNAEVYRKRWIILISFSIPTRYTLCYLLNRNGLDITGNNKLSQNLR